MCGGRGCFAKQYFDYGIVKHTQERQGRGGQRGRWPVRPEQCSAGALVLWGPSGSAAAGRWAEAAEQRLCARRCRRGHMVRVPAVPDRLRRLCGGLQSWLVATALGWNIQPLRWHRRASSSVFQQICSSLPFRCVFWQRLGSESSHTLKLCATRRIQTFPCYIIRATGTCLVTASKRRRAPGAVAKPEGLGRYLFWIFVTQLGSGFCVILLQRLS